jgi:hypothetical protein
MEPPALVETPQRSGATPLALGIGLLIGAAAATAVVLLARPVRSTPTPRVVQSAPAAPTAVPPHVAEVVQPQKEPFEKPASAPAEMARPPDPPRPDRRAARQAARRGPPTPAVAQPGADELLRDAASSLKAGDFNRAYSLANAAAQAGAGANAYLIIGKVFFAKGDLPRAQAEFRRVTGLRPGDREATSFLEVIAKESGRAAQ